MIMYQTHCQRVLDTVVRANFEEVSCCCWHRVAIETVKMSHLNKEMVMCLKRCPDHVYTYNIVGVLGLWTTVSL